MLKLNSFDENIQCIFESESKGTLPFLDVLLCRNNRELTTTVYRKKTKTIFICIGTLWHLSAGN